MSISNSKTKTTSKFIREYGMTLHQLAEKYNSTSGYLYILHLKGELHQFMEEHDKEKAEVAGK